MKFLHIENYRFRKNDFLSSVVMECTPNFHHNLFIRFKLVIRFFIPPMFFRSEIRKPSLQKYRWVQAKLILQLLIKIFVPVKRNILLRRIIFTVRSRLSFSSELIQTQCILKTCKIITFSSFFMFIFWPGNRGRLTVARACTGAFN